MKITYHTFRKCHPPWIETCPRTTPTHPPTQDQNKSLNMTKPENLHYRKLKVQSKEKTGSWGLDVDQTHGIRETVTGAKLKFVATKNEKFIGFGKT